MRLSGSRLADLGLVVLGLATVAAAAAVVGSVGTAAPAPGPSGLARPAAMPSASPSVRAQASAGPVRVLFLGADLQAPPGSPGLAESTGAGLGWRVRTVPVEGAGFTAGPPGRTFVELLPPLLAAEDVDVIVISAGRADAEAEPATVTRDVAQVLRVVRAEQPQARVVLVGPAVADTDAQRRTRLAIQSAAASLGAYYVDLPGQEALAADGDLTAADGSLTAAGQVAVGRSLASTLRSRLIPALLPAVPASPAPSPAPSRAPSPSPS